MSTIIDEVRIDLGETSLVDQAIDDDRIITKVNKYYILTHIRDEKRIARVTATASGYTFAANDTVKTGTPTDWYEIVKAFRVASAGSVFGAPLEVVKVADILRLQSSDATPGTPTRIAFARAATAVISDIGKHDAFLHPIPDVTTYVGLLVRAFPTLLVSPTDVPDLTDLEAYTVAKLAAAELVGIIGEPWRVQEILRPVPDETLAHYGIPRVGYKPPPDPALVAA